MTYELTRSQLASVTDIDLAFGTDELLPKVEDIPQEFWIGNLYTKLAEAVFFGSTLPSLTFEFLESFDDDSAVADLNRCVRAHLQSHSPKHEHKVAGVGFLMARVCRLVPAKG